MFIDLEDINITLSKEIYKLCMKDYQKKSLFKQDNNRELMTKTTKFFQ